MQDHENERVEMGATDRIRQWLTPRVPVFGLDPRFFPEVTRSLIPVETVLRHGVLPLGFKTISRFFKSEKRLNVGFLDPNSKTVQIVIESLIQGKFESQARMEIQRFEVRAEQLLDIIEKVYGVSVATLKTMDSSAVHPKLRQAAAERV